MRIIAVSSQKGGSGKTTLAGHLAIAADACGDGPVALIDTDPQNSLTDWWQERTIEAKPTLVSCGVSGLPATLKTLREAGTRLAFIDTPPAITAAIEAVVQQSDLVIIPTRPSPHDLRAAGATVDLVEHAKKPLIFVVNAATARAKLTGEAAIALSQHGTVAPVIIHNRQDFAASMIDGRTVLEVKGAQRSQDEINRLWTYVADRLKRLPIRSAFRPSLTVRSFGFGRRNELEGTGAPMLKTAETL